MRLCFISDTHTYHEQLQLPECDILIHSGDYSFTGTIPEVNKFMGWFSEQKCTHRVVVNGNHEKMFWANPTLFESLIPKNVTFLFDRAVTLEGLNLYGSPHTKEFCGWAYPYYNPKEAEVIWNRIPDNTDILVTHQPPYKIRDGVPFKLGREGLYVPSLDTEGDPQGCEVLRERLRTIKPMIHSFGHIHEGAGYSEIEGTLYINASICTGKYKPENPCTVVTLDSDKNIISIESVDIQKGYTVEDKRR